MKKYPNLALKVVNSDMIDCNGFVWPEVGGVATSGCGPGLYAWLHGKGDLATGDGGIGSHWLVVSPIGKIINLDGKIKFKSCRVLFRGSARAAATWLIEHSDRELTGVHYATLAGGDGAILTGGHYATLTGRDDAILTGGHYATLTGGRRATLMGKYGATLTGGKGSTLIWIYKYENGMRKAQTQVVTTEKETWKLEDMRLIQI